MKKLAIIIFVLCMCLLGSDNDGQVIVFRIEAVPRDVLAGPILNPANGHEYYLLTNANWTTSEAESVSFGGHLVTINDAAENQWVFDTFAAYGGEDRMLWIGFNDLQQQDVYTWSSGEPLTYTN